MVDIQPTATQPISDDQELAKVLAGVSQSADDSLQFEETPVAGAAAAPVAADPAADAAVDPMTATPSTGPSASMTTDPVTDPNAALLSSESAFTAPVLATGDDLSPIKNEAITELRPLVDKLNLPAEEKFDTYLLLLRSTDDRSLIAPAHAAAQGITDEARKAQALLDIIKEIDYLSQPAGQ